MLRKRKEKRGVIVTERSEDGGNGEGGVGE
jgi:hypothetical protein